jgi:predicted lipoprotein with Yx(FWY)xxD motif
MHLQQRIPVPIHLTLAGFALAAIASTAVLAPRAVSAPLRAGVARPPITAESAAALVRTASNKKLHHRILVNRRGHTLYALSAEKRGRFICTDRSCLSFWTPLEIAPGRRPTGVRSLGTVRRPGGQTQVTYRGRPLYTFNDDHRRGAIGGEGFRDVGVWHAVVVRGG